MRHSRESSPKQLVAYALLSLLIGMGAIYSWATFNGVPSRASLKFASGRVKWTEEYRYGVRFALEGTAENFVYVSKGRAMGVVTGALTDAQRPSVSVLYDPASGSGPVGSGRSYFTVYELAANGRMVRSRGQVEQAWRSDEKVGLYLGVVFLFGSVFLGFSALRTAGAT